MNKAKIKFEEIYKKEPANLAFTPYRICPLGAHSDHQLGKITGFASLEMAINSCGVSVIPFMVHSADK